MEHQSVRFERAGAVGVAILNEAATMNRLTPGLQAGLMSCLQSLPEHPDIRALVLTADGKAFCAGADLDTMAPAENARSSLGERTARAMRELSNPLIMALRSADLPVVIAVNGVAVGGGVGLALAGDIVLMARSASLLLPSTPRLGILPDLGATWALERMAGRSRALALTLLGDRIGAAAAVQFGLAWAAIDDASLRAESIELAQRLARLPKGAAREARAAFEAAACNDLESQLRYESARQAELIDRPAFAEGVRAFLEKREPDFRSLA
jgi:2-(1,2-epoxy-1,2-dihydrophenyl)acetyl-CoA isomerase